MKTKMNLDFSGIPVNDLNANIECHSVIDSRTGVEYTNIGTYMDNKGISESTIRRMIKTASGNKQDHLFVKVNGKYFIHEMLADEAFQNPSKKTTLEEGFRHELRKYNWRMMGSVNFKNGYGELATRKRMESFFRRLRWKFPRTNLCLFFVTESNPGRDGMHSHFLLAHGDEYASETIQGFAVQHFRGKGIEPYANILVESYDKSKDGIGYLLKEVSKHPDGYDIIFHTVNPGNW